jgi:hypothetical protein
VTQHGAVSASAAIHRGSTPIRSCSTSALADGCFEELSKNCPFVWHSHANGNRKWVAKLRATKTDSNYLLLHEYKGDHNGVSGRCEYFWDQAFIYAFILDVAWIKE